jgi:hypothetical protein
VADPPPIPPPPVEPHPEECCQRGCCPCVYDYYANALEKWKVRVRALGGDPDAVLKPRPDEEGPPSG